MPEGHRPAVEAIAKWIAAAAGEDTPSPLTWGDATECLDSLVGDGLVVEVGQAPSTKAETI